MAARARTAIDKVNATQRHARAIRHSREPMIITTNHWEKQKKLIRLFVNPSDMRWNLPRRGTVIKTQGGTVRNTWRNRYRRTYYDEGTVGITFQTGNIMPSAAYDSSELRNISDIAAAIDDPRVPPGLANFYRFMALIDQPMLLGASPNYHRIYHHSRVFPMITLEGFFTEDSFSFNEVVQTGNTLQWEATFQIYRAVPKLGHEMRNTLNYRSFIAEGNYGEQLGQRNVDAYTFAEGIDDHGKIPPASQPKAKITSDTQSPLSGSISGLTNITTTTADRKKISDSATRFRKEMGPEFIGAFFDPSS